METDHQLILQIREHLDTFPERQREIHDMRMLLFGNAATGEKGMKQKTDEIHDILTQSKGVIAFFGGVRGILTFVIIVGAALTLMKSWLTK